MMRKHITLIIMLLFSLGVKAQLVVEPGSFKEVPGFVILDHDKTDINDVPFAVIKIRTQNIDDKQRRELTFGGNLAVDTDLQYKVGEVWLYLTYHADYIKISHPDFSSTEFTFPYDMKPYGCYELTLVNNFNPGPKPEADMGGQYFVLTVTPATANVYVDGDLRATTDGELTIMLPYGEHKYRIEAPSFVGDEGTFTIGKTKVTKTVTLVSAQAQLTLSCGDASAELYLNDKKIGTGSWNGSLDAGMYIVEARRAGHSTVRQSLTLAKQERRSLTLDAPKPIYGKLNLNSTPGNCDVYLDGKKIGTSPDIFSDVLIGTHSIELRKEGYENATKQVTIEENKIAQATVTLTKKQQTVATGAGGGSASYAQKDKNTSPINVLSFNLVPNGIMDEGELVDENGKPDKKKLFDLNDNPVCLVKVKAQGFDESILEKLVINPRGTIRFTHKFFRDGEWYLYVSSKVKGSIVIKYQGNCVYKLPYRLEPKKIYEMILGMETATLIIHATPADAEIYVDDSLVGRGQAIVPVPVGSEHRYRVERDNCYTKGETVTLEKSEKQKEISVELETNFGYISVNSTPSDADVYVDDNHVGKTPYLLQEIATGNHVVRVQKTGYGVFAERVMIEREAENKQLGNVVLEMEAVH